MQISTLKEPKKAAYKNMRSQHNVFTSNNIPAKEKLNDVS